MPLKLNQFRIKQRIYQAGNKPCYSCVYPTLRISNGLNQWWKKKARTHRDGCGLNNEFTNLEIVTQNQNIKMSHGNSVITLYADMNKIYMRFDT